MQLCILCTWYVFINWIRYDVIQPSVLCCCRIKSWQNSQTVNQSNSLYRWIRFSPYTQMYHWYHIEIISCNYIGNPRLTNLSVCTRVSHHVPASVAVGLWRVHQLKHTELPGAGRRSVLSAAKIAYLSLPSLKVESAGLCTVYWAWELQQLTPATPTVQLGVAHAQFSCIAPLETSLFH